MRNHVRTAAGTGHRREMLGVRVVYNIFARLQFDKKALKHVNPVGWRGHQFLTGRARVVRQVFAFRPLLFGKVIVSVRVAASSLPYLLQAYICIICSRTFCIQEFYGRAAIQLNGLPSFRYRNRFGSRKHAAAIWDCDIVVLSRRWLFNPMKTICGGSYCAQ